MGPLVVKAIRPVTKLPLECHLMISDPDFYLDAFAQAGADSILVHVEGNANLHRTLQHIRHLGKKCGVVINPATPPVLVGEVLPDVDLVLVMTVNPGFGGQTFIQSMLSKIRVVRAMIDKIKPGVDLEIDGGVEPHTIGPAAAAGARVFVAGSAIFGRPEGVAAAMQTLVKNAAAALA
jgi:ribulose-phosphate 3-epimerase